MSIPPEQFWNSLRESGLLSDEKVESLRAQLERQKSGGTSSTKIARLLVANEILTDTQARRLLAGKSSTTVTKRPPLPSHERPPTVDDATVTDATETASRTEKSKLPVVLAIGIPLFLLTAAGIYSLSLPKKAASVVDLPPPTIPVKEPQDNLPYEYVESSDALWAREDLGQPIALQYAPAGVQTIVRLRLAKLLAHPEGQKVIRSLGPTLEALLSSWLDRIGVERQSLEVLELYLLPQGTTLPQVIAVGTLKSGTTHESLAAFANKKDNRIAKLATDAIWFPQNNRQAFVFGPSDVVEKMPVDYATADATVLRRELEQLRLATHDTDDVTILVNPNFLRDEAQDLFSDTRRRLLDGLYEFWSEQAQAVSIGVQLSDQAIVEIRMIAREDLPPRRFAALVRNRLTTLPFKISDFLGRAELAPYWQPLAIRFPVMLRFVNEQTRVQPEGNEVAVSTALPAQAVHNLLLASELSLASPVRSGTTTETIDRSTWTVDDVLKSETSIRFAQKSLDVAMRDVARQVRDELPDLPFEFTVEIVGTDLEPEGITRNQQIRDFKATGESVADVLTNLVMKANPVQTVTTASEKDQKLVWVVASDQVGKILVTTRDAVHEKGINLPVIFQP